MFSLFGFQKSIKNIRTTNDILNLPEEKLIVKLSNRETTFLLILI